MIVERWQRERYIIKNFNQIYIFLIFKNIPTRALLNFVR